MMCVPPPPSPSRLDNEHRFHEKRLREIKPVLQVRPPVKFTHLDKKNVKQKRERYAPPLTLPSDREILSDNEKLLNKILRIMNVSQQPGRAAGEREGGREGGRKG